MNRRQWARGGRNLLYSNFEMIMWHVAKLQYFFQHETF